MKLNIRTKILFGFGFVLLLISAVNIYGLTQMEVLAELTTKIYDHPLQVTRAVLTADGYIIRMQRNMQDVLLATNDKSLEEAVAAVNQDETEVYRQLAIAQKNILGQEGQEMVTAVVQLFHQWKPTRDQVIALVREGKRNQAITLARVKGMEQVTSLSDEISKLRDYAASKASEMYDTAQGTRSTVLTTMMSALVIAIVVSGVSGFFLARSISNPLSLMAWAASQIGTKGDLNRDIPVEVKQKLAAMKGEIGQMAQGLIGIETTLQARAEDTARIAQGDLTVEIEPLSEKDEFGLALAQMVIHLRRLVAQVSDNATHLGAASSQLAGVAEQASQATNQMAATIQQIAAGAGQQTEGVARVALAVEQTSRAIDGVAKGAEEQATAITKSSQMTTQLSLAIQQVASNVQAQARGSVEAVEAASNGFKTVEGTVKELENIKVKVGLSSQKIAEMGQRSQQIGAIVETIDDIASQTNLLALNAAIEAARAGEHGKGFAVVADEVRKLAEKSTAATKEIAALIQNIQQSVTEAIQVMKDGTSQVEAGVAQAAVARQALTGIQQTVEAGNHYGEEILVAVEQMKALSNELLGAMETVSAVVEENTAATEEMAAGSSEVTQIVESIAGTSEENSAAIEEVSATAEEMTAQVEEVSAAAQSLNEMAQALQEGVAQFKLHRHSVKTEEAAVGSPPVKQVIPTLELAETTPKMITWDNSMSTGILKVDQQHQQLIAELNRLVAMLRQGKARHEIRPILDFLSKYVETHFNFEEECMEKYNCPVAAGNKTAHIQFVKTLDEFIAEFEQKSTSASLAIKVEKELLNWFVHHIRGVDCQLNSCRKQLRPEEVRA